MSHPTLPQVEKLAAQLPVEDQLMLVEHVSRRLRTQRRTAKPQNLFGIWRGIFPEDFDIDSALKEIRSAWQIRSER